MGRPRKATEDTWFDAFMDWDADDQAAALKVLSALHRQKLRTAKAAPAEQQESFMVGDDGPQ